MKSMVATIVFAASSAFAGVASQNLSFDQLKVACKEPARFQNQNKPSEIKVNCSDRVFKWVPAGNGTMTMPSKRHVYFNVKSDKYSVPQDQAEVAYTAFQGECPIVKQIEEVTALSKDVTCEQVEGFTGTAAELCTSMLDELRAQNAAAIETRETGKTASFCAIASGSGTGVGSGTGTGKPGQRPLK